MVLASQSPRLSPRSRFNTNVGGRRSLGARLALPVTALVVIALGWWGVSAWLGSGTSAPSVERSESAPAVAPTKPQTVVVVNDVPAETKPSVPVAPEPARPAAQAEPQPAATSETVQTPSSGIIGAGQGEAAPAPAGSTAPIPDAGSSRSALDAALAQAEADPVRARVALTRLLEGSALSTVDRMRGYDAINRINGVLLFSNRTLGNDPYSITYKVQPGDSLAKIAKAEKLDCDWRFLQRVNGVSNPSGLRVGQSLKLPRGAFHGEVRKGEYRLNIFMGDGADRVMVASYPIGLGELNSTPTGTFMVRPRSKLIDPEWRNPRTGEFFAANDPKNPIGERWIGLKGIEPHNKGFEGYGIHGTVDLDSIGQQRSMGCVRMRPGDVEVVYELMTEPNSTVTIAP
ncbi:MAG: LysM peptidoglycan-binding domain-containing protein [Planctomycetes bacterium]|nr:LysM peptidoglycan-binding domain-containing protein [Planctomycetota bacterium]